MSTLHLMIGIQGSGKTTLASYLAKSLNIKVISTDEIRKTFKDLPENMVIPKAYEMCALELSKGLDVIYDATNITKKVRKRLTDYLKENLKEYQVGCHYLMVDVETCKKRVELRNNKPGELYLPVEVIGSYFQRLEEPTLDEGYTFIKIYDQEGNQIV